MPSKMPPKAIRRKGMTDVTAAGKLSMIGTPAQLIDSNSLISAKITGIELALERPRKDEWKGERQCDFHF